jgi:MFS family permease
MLLLLGWVSFSFIGGRLLLRVGYRPLVITGMAALASGLLLLTLTAAHGNYLYLYLSVGIVGMGMGLSMFALLIAVQNSVTTNQLGVVTSSTQFFRNIGGAVGTAIMGTLMSIGLRRSLAVMNTAVEGERVNRDLARIVENPSVILDMAARATLSPAAIEHFRVALASGIQWVFIFSSIIGLLALASSLMVPPGRAIDRRGKETSLQPHTAD